MPHKDITVDDFEDFSTDILLATMTYPADTLRLIQGVWANGTVEYYVAITNGGFNVFLDLETAIEQFNQQAERLSREGANS